jgi:hypothetical protein
MSKAYGKLGGKNNGPSVARVASIAEGADGARVLEMVTHLAGGGGRNIPQTSTIDGGVAMWLVQMAVTGFFADASAAFRRGCEILDKALAAHAKAAMEAALKEP